MKKDKYEKMICNLINENGDEKQETTKLSSIWSKNKWYKKNFFFSIYKTVRDNKIILISLINMVINQLWSIEEN